MTWLLLLGGAGTLCLGTLWFVAGVSRAALALRALPMRPLSAVVATGGSVAAISMALQAALGGRGDVALGALVGANAATLGLVLGLVILIRPARSGCALGGAAVTILVAATYALLAVLVDGKVSAPEATLLLAGAVGWAAWQRKGADPDTLLERAFSIEATAEAAEAGSRILGEGRAYAVATASIGLGAVILGGGALLTGAVSLMDSRHASGTAVGLTVAAAGAALPVLVLAVRLALRGATAVALEIALATTTANCLVGLGAAGLTGRVTAAPDALLPHLVVLVVLALSLFYLVRPRRPLPRWKGALLLAGYLAYALRLIGP